MVFFVLERAEAGRQWLRSLRNIGTPCPSFVLAGVVLAAESGRKTRVALEEACKNSLRFNDFIRVLKV
jgi:hypothetical protein